MGRELERLVGSEAGPKQHEMLRFVGVLGLELRVSSPHQGISTRSSGVRAHGFEGLGPSRPIFGSARFARVRLCRARFEGPEFPFAFCDWPLMCDSRACCAVLLGAEFWLPMTRWH